MPQSEKVVAEVLAIVRRLEREAYQKGWRDAVAAIQEAAGQVTAVVRERPRLKRPAMVLGKGRASYKMPVIDIIFQVISEHPGLRGSDIFREAVERVPGSDFKTMDRTGRTALMRLRKRGKIEQRNGKWFPTEREQKKTPAVGSLAS